MKIALKLLIKSYLQMNKTNKKCPYTQLLKEVKNVTKSKQEKDKEKALNIQHF